MMPILAVWQCLLLRRAYVPALQHNALFLLALRFVERLSKAASHGACFGHCAQANDSMVELDDVRYGTRGPFAVNLWMRAQSLNGALFEYLYSHNSTAPDPSGWGPNQVRCLFCSGATGLQLERSVRTCMPVFPYGMHLAWWVRMIPREAPGPEWIQLPSACLDCCSIPCRLPNAACSMHTDGRACNGIA